MARTRGRDARLPPLSGRCGARQDRRGGARRGRRSSGTRAARGSAPRSARPRARATARANSPPAGSRTGHRLRSAARRLPGRRRDRAWCRAPAPPRPRLRPRPRPGGKSLAISAACIKSPRMASILWEAEIAEVDDATSAAMFAPAVLDPVVDRLRDLAAGGHALELAIGTGRVGLALSAHGVRVHGIELSPHMAAQLRAKPGADAVGVTIGDMTTATA